MNYYLIKTVDKLPRGIEPLIMEGRNKISPKGSSTLHEVTTIVYGYKIQLQEELVVLVNDEKVAVPYNPNEHLRVMLRAQRLLLVTDFEMVLDFDGKHSAGPYQKKRKETKSLTFSNQNAAKSRLRLSAAPRPVGCLWTPRDPLLHVTRS